LQEFICAAICTAMLISCGSRKKNVHGGHTQKRTGRPSLHASCYEEERRHSRTPSAHSSDVLPVIDGFGRRVKAGMH